MTGNPAAPLSAPAVRRVAMRQRFGFAAFPRDATRGRQWVARAVLVLACAGGETPVVAQSLFSSSDDVERVRSSVVFDTLWTWGGPSDTLLAGPMAPRSDGAGGLVFFDVLNQSAYRIGMNGDLLWAWGTKGEGPGELQNVRALDVAADGTVVLVDSGNRRVVRLSADGRLLDEAPVREGLGIFSSATALSAGKLAVHSFQPLLMLWGDEVEPAGLPGGLGEPHPLQHQGQTTRWGVDGWVFGFSTGNGWMRFRGAELEGVFPYAEHVEFPEVRDERGGATRGGLSRMDKRPVQSGLSLSVVGDTLFVLFSGESRLRGRVLDKFDVRSGAYLETDLLPHFSNYAVVDKDRAFTIEAWDVSPRIVALARRAAPAQVGRGPP